MTPNWSWSSVRTVPPPSYRRPGTAARHCESRTRFTVWDAPSSRKRTLPEEPLSASVATHCADAPTTNDG